VTDPANLAQSLRSSVCAPAGYGKTHLIGRALLAGPDERHLILTHTHAGVHALRRRLQLLGVTTKRYRIETIAGWALQYAQAFPTTTHYAKPPRAFQENWNNIYHGVAYLLGSSPVKNVLSATYAGVYVDEYQDCSQPQHALVVTLATIIPCRVLGDPLQAIFNFAEPTVDWNNDVITMFPALPPLITPHRWRHDPAFAAWIHQTRTALENRQPLSLRNGLPPAVRVIRPQTFPQRSRAIQETLDQNSTLGKTVVITQWPDQCHKLARQTPGVVVLEPVDGEDFSTAVAALSTATGAQRVNAILEFAAKCFTGFNQQQQQRLARAAQGRSRVRSTADELQIAALKAIHDAQELTSMPEALTALANMTGVRVTRPELYYEVRRSFVAFREGGHPDIQDALAATRQRTRQAGRALTMQSVGRTLLIKGLEFEHAILIAPEELNTQNLYVALTRGTRSLTIITNAETLHPGQT
jgi:superfamily I DNA/RNA helicase